MDNVGSKKGSGGVASQSLTNIHQKAQLSNLLQIQQDPYFIKNNLGQHQCILCHTTHSSNESYLNHVNGKRHQLNVLRRGARDSAKSSHTQPQAQLQNSEVEQQKITYVKEGMPSHKTTKIKDPDSGKLGLLIQLDVPLAGQLKPINDEVDVTKDVGDGNIKPIYRFMTSYEYTPNVISSENTTDTEYQYLLIHCKPYENISFKIPSWEVDLDSIEEFFDPDVKCYYLQFLFKTTS